MTDRNRGWHSPAELALACGCGTDAIEALTRRHHWPRVHGENGGKIGIDIDTVRRALATTRGTVRGSMPMR